MKLLVCPTCRQALVGQGDAWVCQGAGCGQRYGQHQGVPLLIPPHAYVAGLALRWQERPSGGWLARLRRAWPQLGVNDQAAQHFERLAALLQGAAPRPRLLVLGCGRGGDGMQLWSRHSAIELLLTDVQPYPGVMLCCDAHDLPFADASFDGVIAQAVLEHVTDPVRCVAEMHRVLKADGLVYADTPFMQQVHLREFDFQRFTHLGQRRLFRQFEELDSGITCGPGMALAWALYYFLISFTGSRRARGAIRAACALLLYPLRWADRWLLRRDAALDAASSLYFLGRRSPHTLGDTALLRGYRGGA